VAKIKNPYESYMTKERMGFFRIVAQYISCKDGDKVVDIGCGPACILKMLTEKYKIEAYALDWTKWTKPYVDSQIPGVKFRVANLHTTGYETGCFDWAICTQVFEHLEEPQKGLDEILRITKVNGKILLTVPENDYNPAWRHISYWNKKQFVDFLKNAGQSVTVEVLESNYPRLLAIITR